MLAGGDATFKSDLQPAFLSIHRFTHYAVSGTSPLLQEIFIIHSLYHTCFLHFADSVFILVVLGLWHNGAIWQSCCQIAGKAGAPAGRHIAFSFKRQLAPDPHGPFCISIFSKDIKDHKTQDTQTTILPISAIFLVLKVFSCSLLLFCLLLCVTFYRIDTKNDTKITNRLRVVSRAPCLDECFSISFFYPFLKVSKHIL